MKHIKLYEDFSINEGRYDRITNQISSSIFRHWKNDFLSGKVESTFEESFENKDLYIDIVANILFSNDYKEGLNVDGGAEIINTYLDSQDISFDDKADILDLWRKRAVVLSLPKF